MYELHNHLRITEGPVVLNIRLTVSRHQRIAEFSYRKSSAHAKIAIAGEMTGTLDSASKVGVTLELVRYCVDKKLVLAYLGSSRWVKSCVRGEHLVIHLLLNGEHLSKGLKIGEGGDTTILSPGRSPKQPIPEMGLHDPLHGQQACPEFIVFDQGVGQICLR